MHLRKPAYSFFWDWGPQIPVSGIFRPAWLRAWDEARIVDYHIRYKIDRSHVSGTVEVQTTQVENGHLKLVIGDHSFHANITGTGTKVSFEIPDATLWYPIGAGEPFLYDFNITLATTKELDTRTQRLGFRTIQLSQEQRDDGQGTRFLFKVNDQPVFCRGYNWIPFDNDVPRGGEAAYRSLIELARESNVNMLRIWGGGFYEDDEFYRLCDEHGIMVWQDGMFACSLYPDDNVEFMREVEAELADNIKRLRNYTSLVLWCGENECHQAYYQWWADRRQEFPRFYGKKIYQELYPHLVKKLDPDRLYWPGSPFSETPGALPNDLFTGDSHPWLLFVNTGDFTNYRLDAPSFVSETGIQSFPELRTAMSIGTEEDRHFQSFVFETRNHFEHPAKNERLLKFIAALFRIEMDFEKLAVLSNLAQAEYLKYAVEHWRSNAYDCAGVLIWQFNDCWPAISWSAVDYNHLPKALHYFMKRAYARDIVGFRQAFSQNFDPEVEKRGELFVASDHPGGRSGSLTWQVVRKDGVLQAEGTLPVAMTGPGAVTLKEIDIPDFVDRRFDSVMRLEATWDDGEACTNLYTLSRPKFMQIDKPTFSIGQDTERALQISVDTFAKGVTIFHPDIGVVFDDNYFDLVPGESKTITASAPFSVDDLKVLSYYHEGNA